MTTLEDGSVIGDSKPITKQINKFFVDIIGSNPASKFPLTDTARIKVHYPLNNLNFKFFTLPKVNKILNSLDTNKVLGVDGIRRHTHLPLRRVLLLWLINLYLFLIF